MGGTPTEILCRIPIQMPQVVPRPPIWWQKSVTLDRSGFRAWLARFEAKTSWLARMLGLCQDDIILAEANILAYLPVWE